MNPTPAPDEQAPAEPDAQEEFTARLGPKIEELQEQLAVTNERVKRFIKENPGTCVLGAVALGFLVGKWASRR